MRFVALDVETANEDLGSICQVGVLTAEWKSYVDPEDYFDPVNVSIHGITELTVAGAPTFPGVSPILDRTLQDVGVVASHTHFDRVAIQRAHEDYDLAPPFCIWLDTARVARRTWEEVSRSGYGLSDLCSMIGYSFQHHDALEDAKAAGQVLLAAMKKTGLDLEAWLKRVNQPINAYTTSKIALDGDPEGPLYGETVVFTGSLSLPRREAAEIASKAGCAVAPGVTKHTTLLVVGDQDALKLRGREKSGKHRKAEELIAAGQSIRILRESDFCRLVEPGR